VTTQWLPELASRQADGVTVRTPASRGAAWFEGHFPGDPTLPGVALLCLVEEAIFSFLCPASADSAAVAYSRVRFKAVIRPTSLLELRIRQHAPGDSFRFEVDSDGTLACTGICQVNEEPRA
jgi:3-hydroxymyristoyl/3-hydroxydecanoyl-(acyl carrier protein) dehydratase